MQQKQPRVSSPGCNHLTLSTEQQHCVLHPCLLSEGSAQRLSCCLGFCIITDLRFQLCHNKNEPLQTRGSFPFLCQDKWATLSPFATWWPC